MTDTVTIRRELLERIPLDVLKTYGYAQTAHKIESILDAPCQPEVEGLEVEGYFFQHEETGQVMCVDAQQVEWGFEKNNPRLIKGCALTDFDKAHRAIAELREECEHLKDCQENAMLHMTGLVSERDTLRQQLAELRAQLLAIASAEPRRHTIEWAKAMAATGNNEAYAKWREAFDQRDKLAGLLADVKADYTHAIHWEDMHATMKRIDAALAEVKPCLESPAPTT